MTPKNKPKYLKEKLKLYMLIGPIHPTKIRAAAVFGYKKNQEVQSLRKGE